MQDSYQKLTQDVITYLKTLKGPIQASFVKEERAPFIPSPVKQETPKPKELSKQIEQPKTEPAIVQAEEKPTAHPQEEKPPALIKTSQRKKHPSFDVKIEPPKKAQRDPLEDVKKILETIAPSLYLNFNIPKDDQAKRVKKSYQINEYMPDVPVLCYSQKALSFLQGIAEAIDRHFYPSKVIDLSQIPSEEAIDEILQRDHLKLIIAIDAMVFSHKVLMKHYQEFPVKKQRFLGKTPLLLLPDPMIYMKDPSLKRSLWNLLCSQLAPK